MTDKPTDIAERIRTLAAQGDVASLAELAATLANDSKNHEAQIAERDTKIAERDTKIADLHDKVGGLGRHVAYLTRLLYGRRSEKLNFEELRQLCLALGGDPDVEDGDTLDVPVPNEPDDDDCCTSPSSSKTKPKQRRPNHKGRTPLPEGLPRVYRDVAVPPDQRRCKCCGETMSPITPIEHETVEYVPEKLVVHVERREKLACKACKGDIDTAPRQFSHGEVRVGDSFLTALASDKGEDALPIHRIQDRFRRLGWNVPYSTLLRYWSYMADLLIPIAEAIVGKILEDDIVGLDDTGLQVIGGRKGKGQFRGHLWCLKGQSGLTGFRFTETWSHEEIVPWIQASHAFFQVDDYKGYSATVVFPDGSSGPLIPLSRRLGCMMHVRRRFYEAFVAKDMRAAKPVALIKEIYRIEGLAKERGLSAEARHELRQSESIPILRQFYDEIENQGSDIGKTSKYAKAVRYAIAQKPFIERCFTDGRFEIDNGRTEREIRRPAVGRRNYLFTGSVAGGRRLAAIYTIVLSCRGLGIDVETYLIDVIKKLRAGWPLQRLSELIPDNWAAIQTQSGA